MPRWGVRRALRDLNHNVGDFYNGWRSSSTSTSSYSASPSLMETAACIDDDNSNSAFNETSSSSTSRVSMAPTSQISRFASATRGIGRHFRFRGGRRLLLGRGGGAGMRKGLRWSPHPVLIAFVLPWLANFLYYSTLVPGGSPITVRGFFFNLFTLVTGRLVGEYCTSICFAIGCFCFVLFLRFNGINFQITFKSESCHDFMVNTRVRFPDFMYQFICQS